MIDPARPVSRRVLGIEQRPLTLADVGFSFALTGQKSWHGLVPLVHLGAGLASNLRDGVGIGRFQQRQDAVFAIANALTVDLEHVAE